MLQGKTALITGASRGIGKGIAEIFAKNGCNIAFTYASSVEKAMAFEQELTSLYGVKVKGYQSDAANFNQSMALAETVIADFGKIDCLINNAGITRDTLMLRMTEEQWDDVINTNLKSAFNLTKAFLKHFFGKSCGQYHQHDFGCWGDGERRSGQLCGIKSGNDWFYQEYRQGIGE